MPAPEQLLWAWLAIVAVVIVLGWLHGNDPFELFLSAVSLAVAAAPERLPALVNVALAPERAVRHSMTRGPPGGRCTGASHESPIPLSGQRERAARSTPRAQLH